MISLILGGITEARVDAIVDATNNEMLGGGGVDGAIHRAAGPGLREECATLSGGPRCPTGGVRATSAHDLNARFVLHAVGPIYADYVPWVAACYLRSCYIKALNRADQLGCTSIAFPAISTGVYGYPLDSAAPTILHAVQFHLKRLPRIVRAEFWLYDRAAFDAFSAALTSPAATGTIPTTPEPRRIA